MSKRKPAFSGEKLTAIFAIGENADAMRLQYDVSKNSQVLAPNSKYRSRVTAYANQEFEPDKTSSVEEIEVDEVIFAAEDSAK